MNTYLFHPTEEPVQSIDSYILSDSNDAQTQPQAILQDRPPSRAMSASAASTPSNNGATTDIAPSVAGLPNPASSPTAASAITPTGSNTTTTNNTNKPAGELPPTVEMKLIVQNSRAGAIIGIQGSIIREIREETGATVKVSDRLGALDRQVTITGTREQVHAANSVVQRKLAEAELEHAENNVGYGAAPGEMRTGSLSPSPIPPGQMEIRMLVNNSKVGGLIGKGGAAINHIRSQSGCQIKIAKEDMNNPNAAERVISIIGEQPRIELAQQLILMRLNEVSIPVPPIVPPQQQQQQQPHMDVASARAAAMAYPGYPSPAPGHSYQGDASGWAPPGIVLTPPGMDIPSEECVSVPADYVGRVIGKKGATINEIRVQSGCKIIVQPIGDNPTIRVITLIGTDEARKNAKFLISSKIYRAGGV